MILNPTLLKAIVAGSVIASSAGVIAMGIIGEEREERSILSDAELTKDVPEMSTTSETSPVQSEVTTNQQVATHPNGFPRPQCHIHVVEKPEGYGDGRAVRWRLWTYKVKRDHENYETGKGLNDLFRYKCEDFGRTYKRKRVYVYYNKETNKGVGSPDLQGKDGLYELGEESKFSNYRSFN